MNPKTSSSALLHCQHRSVSGHRFCRMPISDQESGFCLKHAAALKKDRAAVDLAAKLIGDTGEFRSAVAINHSLGELYKLLARDEIAPRRAAVMAYTGSLLLRTLPAIDRELGVEYEEIIGVEPGDIPRPYHPVHADFGDLPRPDRSQPYRSVILATPADVSGPDRGSRDLGNGAPK